VTFSFKSTPKGTVFIERDGDVLWLVVLQQLPKHLRETVDGVRGQAVRVRQIPDRVVSAIEIVGAVDDEESWLLRHEWRRIIGA